MISLYINNVEVPLTKGSYNEKWSNYQVTGQTEAGTNRRDLIRSKILGLSVTFQGTDSDKATILTYAQSSSLTVKHYQGSTLTTWTAYLDNLSCNALIDGEWEISFDLIDLEQ